MNTTPAGPGPLEQITFEIFTNFKAGIPAKNVVIVAVDPRMAPSSPTMTALGAAFGRFAGIHAALLSMPIRPLGYRHGPLGRPSGRCRCAVLAAKREGSPAGEAKEQIMRLRLESTGLLPQPRQSISNGFKQRGAGTGGPAAPIARMF